MKDKIIEIVRGACALPEQVEENTALKSLSLDSLSFVEMLVELENAFGIEFDIDAFDALYNGTAGDIVVAVKEKTNG
ncbi:MAG: hypothetical protein K2M95_08185 [Clostridiales bacterium]|nr:hypothetical protein [Clostridiales bacterium]